MSKSLMTSEWVRTVDSTVSLCIASLGAMVPATTEIKESLEVAIGMLEKVSHTLTPIADEIAWLETDQMGPRIMRELNEKKLQDRRDDVGRRSSDQKDGE